MIIAAAAVQCSLLSNSLLHQLEVQQLRNAGMPAIIRAAVAKGSARRKKLGFEK